MSENESVVEDAPPADKRPDENLTKAELQRRMEEAREDISETVAEIKGVVAYQYDGVKEGIEEVLDWREQFDKNPIVWGAGAVSVGILIGIGLSHAFEETRPARGGRRRRSPEISSLGEHLIGEVSGLADAVLPTLTGKVKEMFGVDLSAYLPIEGAKEEKRPRAAAKRLAGKKGSAVSKKRAAKKRSAK